MGSHDTKMVTTLAKHGTLRGVTVTFNALPTVPQAAVTSTAGVAAFVRHQADLTPQTQGPFQQRVYWIPTAAIATPRRSDYITDADGTNWTIMDVRLARSGLTYCQTRIGQVDA